MWNGSISLANYLTPGLPGRRVDEDFPDTFDIINFADVVSNRIG